MKSAAHIPKLQEETKSRILSALHEGSEGAACAFDADQCVQMLREARTWTLEQWHDVGRKLRVIR